MFGDKRNIKQSPVRLYAKMQYFLSGFRALIGKDYFYKA